MRGRKAGPVRDEVLDADVAVIGAGVVGTAIAWQLSRLDLSVVVIEQRDDVGDGTSKSNSGITASGWTLPSSSLEARLVTASSSRWEDICDRLGVEFRRCGMAALGRSEDDRARIPALIENARRNGVDARLVEGNELGQVAPHASRDVTAAVWIPSEGVIDSVRLPIAYAQLAALNGATFFLGEPVIGSSRAGRTVTEIVTPRRRIRTRFVVNAAGLGADDASSLLGTEDFDVLPRRGQWLLLDRDFGKRVSSILTGLPTERTHGVMVIPTAHGSVLLGPTAEDIEAKQDRSTAATTLQAVLAECRTLMPAIDSRSVIKSFAGVRPHSVPTYRIERSALADNVITIAGIRSTGVSGSPGIADYVVGLLSDAGLAAKEKHEIVERINQPVPLRRSGDCAASAAEPLGRTIVCTCEKVTAAEIHRALQGPLGARSIGGIARRTHATWGRCQGSACLSGVTFIASLYLDGQAWEIPVGERAATLGVAPARRK
jgi:glycerol-3-phosphate dehydrogenase